MSFNNSLMQKMRSSLARGRQRQLRRVAIDTALVGTLGYHPEFQGTGFDRHLMDHGAAPLVAAYVDRGRVPDAQDLAAAWAAQLTISPRGRAEAADRVMPLVNDFVHLLMSEERSPVLVQADCMANGAQPVPVLSH